VSPIDLLELRPRLDKDSLLTVSKDNLNMSRRRDDSFTRELLRLRWLPGPKPSYDPNPSLEQQLVRIQHTLGPDILLGGPAQSYNMAT
jgi:hypothetical protein